MRHERPRTYQHHWQEVSHDPTGSFLCHFVAGSEDKRTVKAAPAEGGRPLQRVLDRTSDGYPTALEAG